MSYSDGLSSNLIRFLIRCGTRLYMNGALNETRAHSFKFASLASKSLHHQRCPSDGLSMLQLKANEFKINVKINSCWQSLSYRIIKIHDNISIDCHIYCIWVYSIYFNKGWKFGEKKSQFSSMPCSTFHLRWKVTGCCKNKFQVETLLDKKTVYCINSKKQ